MKEKDTLCSLLNFARFARKELPGIRIVYKKYLFLSDGKKRMYCPSTCNIEKNEIRIRRELPRDVKNISIIHELLHFYYDDLNLDNKIPDFAIDTRARAIYEHWPHFSERLLCYLPVESGSS